MLELIVDYVPDYFHLHYQCLTSYCIFMAAVWSGAKLADVLELVGIPKLTSATPPGGKHVEFVSIDKCKVKDL